MKARFDFLIGILSRKKKYMAETLKWDGSKVIMEGIKQIAIGEIEKIFDQIKNLELYMGASEIDWNFECNDFKKEASFNSWDYLVHDAIFEIVRNSIEKAPSGRRTTISIEILKESAVQRPILVIKDSGNGVDPDTLANLNQCKFHRKTEGLRCFRYCGRWCIREKCTLKAKRVNFFRFVFLFSMFRQILIAMTILSACIRLTRMQIRKDRVV